MQRTTFNRSSLGRSGTLKLFQVLAPLYRWAQSLTLLTALLVGRVVPALLLATLAGFLLATSLVTLVLLDW